jgi:hypothetical protein
MSLLLNGPEPAQQLFFMLSRFRAHQGIALLEGDIPAKNAPIMSTASPNRSAEMVKADGFHRSLNPPCPDDRRAPPAAPEAAASALPPAGAIVPRPIRYSW